MIARARIVIAETRTGELKALHASFDAVAAHKEFVTARTNPDFADVALFENGVITRVARPAKAAATVAAAAPAPKEPPKTAPLTTHGEHHEPRHTAKPTTSTTHKTVKEK
jgi:hypothetical protein